MKLKSRKPSQDEIRLLDFLIQKSVMEVPIDWQTSLQVIPLDDGGMGSLLLLPEGVGISTNRLFGEQVSECQFKDVDGIYVVVSLNVDREGKLFELNIWKTDFTPLETIPPSQDFK